MQNHQVVLRRADIFIHEESKMFLLLRPVLRQAMNLMARFLGVPIETAGTLYRVQTGQLRRAISELPLSRRAARSLPSWSRKAGVFLAVSLATATYFKDHVHGVIKAFFTLVVLFELLLMLEEDPYVQGLQRRMSAWLREVEGQPDTKIRVIGHYSVPPPEEPRQAKRIGKLIPIVRGSAPPTNPQSGPVRISRGVPLPRSRHAKVQTSTGTYKLEDLYAPTLEDVLPLEPHW